MAELPSVGNAVQSSEMMRNSLGLNYKSAALLLGAGWFWAHHHGKAPTF
jgi:hypothetical protein